MNNGTKSQLIVSALCDAIKWRDSLAEANGYDSTQGAKEMARVARYRQLLKEIGYKESAEMTGESISIQEISRRANADG